ncbi:protein virilizer homolog [Rhopilema esculentum]|uniref:protein virilizer homolog n=1 Tax=Rhopilema esculentum TaxID=499914 RepID=UPI0031D03411
MVANEAMANTKFHSPSLLFFDTFQHAGELEEMHLDLVGFPRPVAIQEVRVIPHGCRIHTEIKDKFGETSPSSFKLETFVKNLNRPNATVFERLGTLEYKDGESFRLVANSKLATNVVLLRGWYSTLTVCLYGEFTEVVIDNKQVPPPPPPQHSMFGLTQRDPMSAIPSQIAAVSREVDLNRERRELAAIGISAGKSDYSVPRDTRGYYDQKHGDQKDKSEPNRRGDEQKDKDKRDGQLDGRDREKDMGAERKDKRDGGERGRGKGYDKRKQGSGSAVKSIGETSESKGFTKDGGERAQDSPQAGLDSLFEPLSPEDSDFIDIANDGANDEIGYEDIESDEDNFDDFDFEDPTDLSSFQELEFYGTEDTWMSVSVSFNPYQCDLSTLESFEVPGLSEFDTAHKTVEKELEGASGKEEVTGASEAKQLLAMVNDLKGSPVNAKLVSAIEDIPPLLPQGLAYLTCKGTHKDALDVLVRWSSLFLDVNEAMKLPVGVNIRQLKAGVKLASHLCRCNEDISTKMMEAGIQRQLVALLKTENMASSIRLLVVQALDSTTDMTAGIEHFLGWNIKKEEAKGDRKGSPYEEIVQYLLTEPAVRVITAIKRLLRKAHFYESLASLQSLADRLCNSMKSEAAEEQKKVDLKKEEDDAEIKKENGDEKEKNMVSDNNDFLIPELFFSNDDLEIVMSALDDIQSVLSNAQELISQPALKNFPTSAKVVDIPQNDCRPTVFSLLRKRRFLEAILILISSPVFCEPAIFSKIRDLLFSLLDDEKGLVFLASEPNTMNGMIRILTQSSEAESHYSEAPSLKELKNDSSAAENCVAHHLGLLLIYHLQSLQGIDQLISAEKTGISPNEMDDADNLSTLHTLYSMTFTPIGKVAVTSVLSQRDNLRCLMPFVEHTEGENEGKTRRSVSSKYASVLLLSTIQISENIKSLEKFGSKLLAVPKKEADTILTELGHYLTPFDRIIKVDLNAIANLVEYIKGELDSFKTNANSPRGIHTALRLLKYICIAPSNEQGAEQKELKWSLAIIQLFSANAIDTFLQLLNKLGERLVTPWRQNQAFSSHHCFVLVSLAVPLLQLIHAMLRELIDSGKVPFKDARLLHGVFVLHTILCSRPVTGQLVSTISQVQSEIVSILLKFTSTTAPESQDVLKASSWYLMLKELVQYTCSKPQAFLSGVVLLSELLPVPFPVHAIQDLTPDDIKALSNHRILWMVHIGALGDEIQSMLKSLVGSCCTYLQHSLRKLCLQLCDLGAVTALSTIRFLCEAFEDEIGKISRGQKDDEEKTEGKEDEPFENSCAARVVSLLSSAVSQPGGKLAFLQLTRQGEEQDCEFGELMPKILELLSTEGKSSENPVLIHGILGLLTSLCDAQITINEFQDPFKPQNLANNLPHSSVMQSVASAVLSFACNATQSYQLIPPAIRVLMNYTDFDYGMQILQRVLDEGQFSIGDVLMRLENEICNKGSQDDALNSLSTLLDFLRLLLPLSAIANGTDGEQREEGYSQSNRKLHVCPSKLKGYLNIDINSESNPIHKLIDYFKNVDKDDVNSASVLPQLTSFVEAVQSEDEPSGDKDEVIVLPNPETVQQLFTDRVHFLTAMVDDERLEPMLWFLSPPPEDIDVDCDMVKVDLEAIAEKYCPGFNLKEEVEKGFTTTDDDKAKRTKRSRRKFDPLVHGKDLHVDDLKRQRLDVSWLQRGRGNFRGRGRGFGRGYVDLFRSRKQNTSRPPSMHVDDFIMMEGNVASPSDGQNKQQIKSSFAAPVRTASSEPRFTGGFSDSQGRWASPATASFRREGEHPQVNRGGFGTWGGQAGFTPQYSRGGGFQRGGSSWSPQIASPYRAPRESQSTYPRSSFRGGYWAGPKPKEDNSRFFAGGAFAGYRQNQGNDRDGFNRHLRTFTR